jgi:hypothetical protein
MTTNKRDDIRDGLEIKKSWGLSDFRINDDCKSEIKGNSRVLSELDDDGFATFHDVAL